MWGKKKAAVNDRLNRLEAENIGLEGRVMIDKKTDLDRLLGKYVGLGFEVRVRRESGCLRMECRTSDETLHFWFGSNGDVDGDIEKALENAPKNEPTHAETIDARLRTLEADNARFDERVAESIKRLSESGHITSSSGNALNVRNIPDAPDIRQTIKSTTFNDERDMPRFKCAHMPIDKEDKLAAKAEFFGDRVEFVSVGGQFSEAELAEAFEGVESTRLMEGEELPHTLPPHIMGIVDECKRLRVERAKLLSEIKSSSVGNYLRLANTATNEMNNVESCLVEVVIEHFGVKS